MDSIKDKIILIELFFSAFILYLIGLYIYRVFFHRLSHIPGPKLAAASLWYEFYYDVVLKGRYTFKIKELHEEYGPIIRISPYEIHINDPEYIDTVYPGSSPRTMKYPWSQKMFGLRTSIIMTESHELHRIRRGAIAHYFSVKSLRHLEPGVQSQIDKLISRLHGLKGSNTIINLFDVFGSLTGDVISQYGFARPYGFLDDPNFSPYWHKLLMDISQNGHVLKQFGWMLPLMGAMPVWIAKIMNPQMLVLVRWQAGFRPQIMEVKESVARGEKPPGQTTIFYDVLSNPQVRPQEKETDHLQDEAQTLIGAGTVTTAHILATTTFHLIENPSIREKLQAELEPLMQETDGKPKWSQLEQLPYLSAIIQEGLRIGYGVSHRLQRVFPDNVLEYNGYTIPAMTPVGMTAVLIHDNPSLFPEPRTYNPDRFLKQPGLKKYIFTFGKGSRNCAGYNLAYAELYLVLAAIFAPGRFNWELYETDVTDVEAKHDFLNTSPKLDSKGIRVVVN